MESVHIQLVQVQDFKKLGLTERKEKKNKKNRTNVRFSVATKTKIDIADALIYQSSDRWDLHQVHISYRNH